MGRQFGFFCFLNALICTGSLCVSILFTTIVNSDFLLGEEIESGRGICRRVGQVMGQHILFLFWLYKRLSFLEWIIYVKLWFLRGVFLLIRLNSYLNLLKNLVVQQFCIQNLFLARQDRANLCHYKIILFVKIKTIKIQQ